MLASLPPSCAEMAVMMFIHGRADLGIGAALKAIPLALALAAAAKAVVDRRLQSRWGRLAGCTGRAQPSLLALRPHLRDACFRHALGPPRLPADARCAASPARQALGAAAHRGRGRGAAMGQPLHLCAAQALTLGPHVCSHAAGGAQQAVSCCVCVIGCVGAAPQLGCVRACGTSARGAFRPARCCHTSQHVHARHHLQERAAAVADHRRMEAARTAQQQQQQRLLRQPDPEAGRALQQQAEGDAPPRLTGQ